MTPGDGGGAVPSARREVDEILLRARTLNALYPSTARRIPRRPEEIRRENAETNLKMKKYLGYGAFIAIGLQLLVADAVFVWYACESKWVVPGNVMISWLSATVIQVVGIVLVIARHLFPTPVFADDEDDAA